MGYQLYTVRNDLNFQKDNVLESIFIETHINDNDKIVMETIYRPPNNNFDDFETHLKSVLQTVDKEKKTCMYIFSLVEFQNYFLTEFLLMVSV